MKEQLREWLEEFHVWGEGGVRFRFSEKDGRGKVVFCTTRNIYYLSFTDTYLGATVTSRTARPGEDWLRGNDLPDGEFSRETFDKIICAVFAYELVPLVPEREPVAVQAE